MNETIIKDTTENVGVLNLALALSILIVLYFYTIGERATYIATQI